MSALTKLALTDRTQARAKVNPVIRSRTKFAAALQTQINIVEAEAKGETYTVERMRWETNEDGERVRVPKQIVPRAWFWTEEDGTAYFGPKIGVRPLEIEKGKPTIRVGPVKELVPTLEMLIQAVSNGELDGPIAEANSRKKSA
jgi:hypothetical protein